MFNDNFKSAVIQRHTESINNAKNLTESESRRHSLLLQRDCEEAERAHGREIERLREDFERSMREKEERHRSKIREFQDRDNAWQQEKQVRISSSSSISVLSSASLPKEFLECVSIPTSHKSVCTLQDILSEIQRLKEEANRFIAILAKEEEDADENLSPARRQTLTREVESLQVISHILKALPTSRITNVLAPPTCNHNRSGGDT